MLSLAELIGLLSHDDPAVRRAAAGDLAASGTPAVRPLIDAALAASRYDRKRYLEVLHHIGEPALGPLVDAVLPLVSTEQPISLDLGVWPLAPIGPAVLPELRRRRRTPGRYRRQALTALAEIGGWAALDAVDQALIRRLIRVKQAHEVPQPMDLQSTWFAVRTVEQAAVLEATGSRGTACSRGRRWAAARQGSPWQPGAPPI